MKGITHLSVNIATRRTPLYFKSLMVEKKNQRTVVVARVPTEPEAALIVAQLKNAGIRAGLVGALTSTFRAEAPGEVKVIVLEEDAEKAVEFLRKERR